MRVGASPAQEHGNVLGLKAVILGFAPMDGFPIQRMPKDKRHAFTGTVVGQPIPGEESVRRRHDHICLVGRDGLQKRCWASWQVPVEKHLSALVEDTEIHGAGMQIEATVTLMLLRVEAPEVSSVPS
jgi:hypothetical protein